MSENIEIQQEQTNNLLEEAMEIVKNYEEKLCESEKFLKQVEEIEKYLQFRNKVYEIFKSINMKADPSYFLHLMATEKYKHLTDDDKLFLARSIQNHHTWNKIVEIHNKVGNFDYFIW
jgi:hypothetical protein